MTFALMAYNSELYVKAAISGALSQTYEPAEIILSDDCSSDSTFQIMESMAAEYRGAHTLILNRNSQNLGLCGHINRLMELCSGEVIAIAAADDVSLPDRLEKTCEAYLASDRKARSLCSSCILIDETGAEIRHIPVVQDATNLESLIIRGSYIYGCTHAWHRSVFDTFGPLPTDVRQEDEVIPFRSLVLGTISRIREPLVRYRMHSNNLSLEYKQIAKDESELQELYAIQFAQRLNNLKCYLGDLKVARDYLDERRWEKLRTNLLKMINECDLEIAFRQGEFSRRVEVLGQGIGRKVRPATLAKWLVRLFLPRAYAKYCYYRYCRSLKPDLLFAEDSAAARME